MTPAPATHDVPDIASDEALIARMRAGDERAWGAFVARYERLIYAVPRRMGLNAADAADVLQDTLAALLKGLARVREPRALPRWLMQTAFRLSRDLRRKRAREHLSEPETFDGIAGGTADPQALLLDLEARGRVQAALERIPERCRELLGALFFEEPSPGYAAIGARLGMPVGSLGPTRQRCLDRLLEALGGPEEPGGGRIRMPANPTSKGRERTVRTPRARE